MKLKLLLIYTIIITIGNVFSLAAKNHILSIFAPVIAEISLIFINKNFIGKYFFLKFIAIIIAEIITYFFYVIPFVYDYELIPYQLLSLELIYIIHILLGKFIMATITSCIIKNIFKWVGKPLDVKAIRPRL